MTRAVDPVEPVKLVRCPGCRGPSVYAASNPYRPFCSERCKQMDLGAWASERFVVPVETLPDDLGRMGRSELD